MESKVLALKYRPKNFDELVGQESVSKTLKYSLVQNNLANAYLFSGLRGSGKTSSARIFAKTILCEKAPTSNPCEVCDSCKMANSSSHIDIIEMDAASNRKIDDIRDLIDQTQYQPSIGKYKIFIIDEVHMLTKEAFNALLKTLEEPPEYIKFILATTDALKLPPTILSRTQHFHFKKIDKKLIEKHLIKILELENITFDSESVQTISRSGGGSLRDTLTILQQAIVYCNNNLNISDITEMLGLIDPVTLDNLLNVIIEKDRPKLLETLRNMQNYDAEIVIDEFINFIKEKILDTNIEISLLDKIFSSLNSGKTLLFTGADNEFVLYLTFLKMVAENTPQIQKIVEIQKVEQIQEVVKIAKPEISNQENTYKTFFDSNIVDKIIGENSVSRNLTDEMLKNCINKHIDFMEIKNDQVFIKFYFKDECKCQTTLRSRYKHIQTIIIREFSEKYKIKFKFVPKVVKEYKTGLISSSEKHLAEIVEKKIETTPVKVKIPETIESCLFNIKEIFNIEDKNIEKIENQVKKIVETKSAIIEKPVGENKDIEKIEQIKQDPEASSDSLFGEETPIDFIFDFETNGFKGSDAISISFIIAKGDKILYEQSRYYFPQGDWNAGAQRIHHLDYDKVDKFREGHNYPRYFKDDFPWLIDIVLKYSVTNFVAHNISFDLDFLPLEIQKNIKSGRYFKFCTMKENAEFVGIINDKGNFKNPKLSETCDKYGISFDESEAHDSKYDTEKAFAVYRKTKENETRK